MKRKMSRSDAAKILYAAGIPICALIAYSMYASLQNGGGATPHIILISSVLASMVLLLASSLLSKRMTRMDNRRNILTVVSGPSRDRMRSRGIIGKMPPMSR